MNFFIVYNNVVVVVAAAAIILITLFGLSNGEKPEHSVSFFFIFHKLFFSCISIIHNQMQICCFSQITCVLSFDPEDQKGVCLMVCLLIFIFHDSKTCYEVNTTHMSLLFCIQPSRQYVCHASI